jgi:hypothetical protein
VRSNFFEATLEPLRPLISGVSPGLAAGMKRVRSHLANVAIFAERRWFQSVGTVSLAKRENCPTIIG